MFSFYSPGQGNSLLRSRRKQVKRAKKKSNTFLPFLYRATTAFVTIFLTSTMEISSPFYFGPHHTTSDCDTAFNNAQLWAGGEGEDEAPAI
jgi:hypothetical protein